MDLYN